MLIGLGGGAASSSASGESSVELDFDSVQRGNPEMERRAQMVIDACVALGENNPIAFIHDVGAGGLSNALPELVKDAGYGGQFELRQVESADSSMSPLQIWCCEAQERYVMIVNAEGMNRFMSIASKYFLQYRGNPNGMFEWCLLRDLPLPLGIITSTRDTSLDPQLAS